MADELILTLDFETPPRADELGELFAALARDYRDMTNGRVLVVTRVESGSIDATLTDLVLTTGPYVHEGIAMAATAMVTVMVKDFYDYLKGRLKSEDGGKRLYRQGKTLCQRSIKAITKIVIRTRGLFRLKHKTENGETREFELTSVEAKKVRERTSVEQRKMARVKHGPETKVMPHQVQLAIERLHHAGESNLSSTQIQAMVDLIVADIQGAGVLHLLPEISSDFELHGLHNFAAALRQHLRRQP